METNETAPLHSNKLRVLVIDDEKNIRTTLSLCLEQMGCTVTAVSTPEAALAALRQQPYELSFLDLRLGGADGLDVISKLLAIDAASMLNDLRAPPGNRLEALHGARKGQFSIRVNDQWRICFTWSTSGFDTSLIKPPSNAISKCACWTSRDVCKRLHRPSILKPTHPRSAAYSKSPPKPRLRTFRCCYGEKAAQERAFWHA